MANSVESCCLEEIRGAGARPERGADVREKGESERNRKGSLDVGEGGPFRGPPQA